MQNCRSAAQVEKVMRKMEIVANTVVKSLMLFPPLIDGNDDDISVVVVVSVRGFVPIIGIKCLVADTDFGYLPINSLLLENSGSAEFPLEPIW